MNVRTSFAPGEADGIPLAPGAGIDASAAPPDGAVAAAARTVPTAAAGAATGSAEEACPAVDAEAGEVEANGSDVCTLGAVDAGANDSGRGAGAGASRPLPGPGSSCLAATVPPSKLGDGAVAGSVGRATESVVSGAPSPCKNCSSSARFWAKNSVPSSATDSAGVPGDADLAVTFEADVASPLSYQLMPSKRLSYCEASDGGLRLSGLYWRP